MLAAAASLFGWHVVGSAKGRAAHREGAQLAFKVFGQSKIGDVWLAAGVEQDVRGLLVAMQNAVLVRMMDRARDGSDEAGAMPNFVRALPSGFSAPGFS